MNVITLEREEELLQKCRLGDHSPQVLSNIMVYLIGLCFALKSSEEHRRLCHRPSHIELVEPLEGSLYLIHKEDVFKNKSRHQRNLIPNEVLHYANIACPARCLVRLYII